MSFWKWCANIIVVTDRRLQSGAIRGCSQGKQPPLDNGPVWAQLLIHAVGRDPEPTGTGPLGECIGDNKVDHAEVPVQVYPSDITVDGGDR